MPPKQPITLSEDSVDTIIDYVRFGEQTMVKIMKKLILLAIVPVFLLACGNSEEELLNLNESSQDENSSLNSNSNNNSNNNNSDTFVTSILGKYECHEYDEEGKNDWHYVTISQVNNSTLKWSNRAGVSWTLYLTEDKTKLDVGRDSPYFKDGHREVTVVWERGQILGLMGPGNELYRKLYRKSS